MIVKLISTVLLVMVAMLGTQCRFAADSQNGADSLQGDSVYTSAYILGIHLTDPSRALELTDTAVMKNRMPEYQADFLRYIIYADRSMYQMADKYLEQLLQSDSLKTATPDFALRVKTCMVEHYMMMSCYDKAMAAATEACEAARDMGNIRLESEMLYQIGAMYLAQQMPEKAESYVQQAADLLEKSSDIRHMAYLSFIYGQQMNYYYGLDQIDKAVLIGEKRGRLIDAMISTGGAPDGYYDEQQGYLYSKLAAIYFVGGKRQQAAQAFARYSATNFSKTYGSLEAVPYLILSGRSAEAKALLDEGARQFTDTISTGYITVLSNYEQIAVKMGDYSAALDYRRRICNVQDSITARNNQDTALEMATVFETAQKDKQIEHQKLMISRHKTVMWAALIFFLFFVAIIGLLITHLRVVKDKNRSLAKQLDSQIICRNELQKAQEEIMALKQSLKEATDGASDDAESLESGDSELEPGGSELESGDAELDSAGEEDHHFSNLDKQKFDALDNFIDKEKVYLNSDISREELMQHFHISKNTFARLIQHYTGTNFNGYINEKRLRYSVSLLQDCDHYTIEAIALESGFNTVRNFHRIFREKFGLTPTEYRNTLRERRYLS